MTLLIDRLLIDRLLIDRNGKIAASHAGLVNKAACENEIRTLLQAWRGEVGPVRAPPHTASQLLLALEIGDQGRGVV